MFHETTLYTRGLTFRACSSSRSRSAQSPDYGRSCDSSCAVAVRSLTGQPVKDGGPLGLAGTRYLPHGPLKQPDGLLASGPVPHKTP